MGVNLRCKAGWGVRGYVGATSGGFVALRASCALLGACGADACGRFFGGWGFGVSPLASPVVGGDATAARLCARRGRSAVGEGWLMWLGWFLEGEFLGRVLVRGFLVPVGSWFLGFCSLLPVGAVECLCLSD